ncbi:Spy/CpxP family protein refolding chaperone [Winogradskyella psychrotolerans]|uniref:Spy/CpxP family protein refolding chaperone n=1 Tax=Winogradskyella psychrotolerans TaxID=1344585 RepID=UPI001C06BF2B|nr:sensor of ECF-type sigma factor [Winogradskyella psychrotolerans]MBU2929696.1 sensor of ECF-type sigma factor [Winogradskyella psychrotolerans]
MKTIHTLILTLFISTSIFAQKLDREKIKALKIAHITEQLNLTETEAQKFWPIYNANEDAESKLRENSTNRRKDMNVEELSESEAKSLLLAMEKVEKQKVELHSKMLNELLEILPAKKIIKMYQAERSFRQKMFEEYKKRHSKQ